MPDPAPFAALAESVLSAAAHPTELVWRERAGGLTRFANNGVHQHAETSRRECIVRVCKDGRFGVVTVVKRHVAVAASQQPSLAAKRISPHTLRHTAAMHLLQSGVELNVIKSWLGHVSITTTSQYIEIDMAMKREALDRCSPPVPAQPGDSPWHCRKDIVEWLEDL